MLFSSVSVDYMIDIYINNCLYIYKFCFAPSKQPI